MGIDIKTKKTECWRWYVARENEIFCDLDSLGAVRRARAVLGRVVRRRLLPIQAVYFYPSSPEKAHLIVILKRAMKAERRALWALWMGSDKVRAIYTLERLNLRLKNADLLITRYVMEHRREDGTCRCKDKHKRDGITRHCPMMKRLLGKYRDAEFFPRNFVKEKIWPRGRVPVSMWREELP